MRSASLPELMGKPYTSKVPIGQFDGYPSLTYHVSDDDPIVVHGVMFILSNHEQAIDLSRTYGAEYVFHTSWLSQTDQYLVDIFWDDPEKD